jgi:hypothetical protein
MAVLFGVDISFSDAVSSAFRATSGHPCCLLREEDEVRNISPEALILIFIFILNDIARTPPDVNSSSIVFSSISPRTMGKWRVTFRAGITPTSKHQETPTSLW